MKRRVMEHLDKMADEAKAVGKSYGAYVADHSHPVTVILPDYLKFAPTMFERLAGEEPPPAPKYEHVRKAEPGILEKIRPTLPPRPNVDQYHTMSLGMTDAPWLKPKRRAARLSINHLGDICKISYKTLWRWEDSGRVPTVFAEYISQVLDAYINFGSASQDDNE